MKVKSVPITLPPGAALVDLLPDAEVVGWLHGDDGMVGWGQAFRLDMPAAHQFPAAKHAWQQAVAAAEITDEVGAYGSGLVGFGSFAFDPRSAAGGVLIIPRVVIGKRGDTAWLTTINSDVTAEAILAQHQDKLAKGAAATPVMARAPYEVTEVGDSPGGGWSLSISAWEAAVAEALERIAAGEIEKVVLAREITLSALAPFSPTWALQRLAHHFTDTWNYAIDAFVGATPELLVSVRGAQVKSLVLAGTAPRPPEANDSEVWQLGNTLLDSMKDKAEHAHAVNSVANVLNAFCRNIHADGPRILDLPNVLHLVTSITAEYADPQNAITSLYLAEALHPSAAVCGTPKEAALEVIRDLEDFDRGRYAGPVGWISANGDGEWGIALRCAQLVGSQAHLFAGCGIVAGSQPALELLESEAKLGPMRWALAGNSQLQAHASGDASLGDDATSLGDDVAENQRGTAASTTSRPKLRLIKGD